MKVNTSKSKNAESFYIKQSYINSNGKSTSRTVRKLGTLKELLIEHGPTRDDVMLWAKEQARIEAEKFEQEKANFCIPITFYPNRKISHGEKWKFQGVCRGQALDVRRKQVRKTHIFFRFRPAFLSLFFRTNRTPRPSPRAMSRRRLI